MRKNLTLRFTVLVVLVLAITALHYGTTIDKDQFHDIYRRLYYIPIILAGVWFCLRGGVVTAAAVSLLYAPHVVFQWGHHHGVPLEQYLELLLYNIIGILTGILSGRERQQTRRYRETALRLEESYRHLKDQADQILEIEDQLRRADRLSALGELSAGMAHEIRNPLGSIRGTAEILRDGVSADDPRYEFTEILMREADRLNRVVQDFLDFARPAAPVHDQVDLNQSLREVLALTSRQAERAGVAVRFEPVQLPPVAADREQLKQVFLNLILNAIQAMPGGGQLTIGGGVADGTVRISFTDTGQGIAEADREKIFSPFFTTRRDGTGLGLAITSRIVRGHCGSIAVESRPGMGTCFTVILPMGQTRENEHAGHPDH